MVRRKSFSKEVQTAAEIALQVGRRVERLSRNPGKLQITTKFDAGYGHSSSSTSADALSQQLILQKLRQRFANACILTEEKPGNEDRLSLILTRDTLYMMQAGITFGVDPIDGTSEFKNGLYEWALSIGVMRDGVHMGGAIYAPAIRGGILVVGERGKGAFLSEAGKKLRKVRVSSRIASSEEDRKKLVIYLGCDFHWLPEFAAFEKAFAKQVNRTKSTGSCAVGLAMVAAGKVDVLIQPVQKPWDWFAGYPLVEEAGGKFQFYHYREGTIEPLAKPDLVGYDPKRPNLAFIAGNPELVDWLFELLLANYGK
jgi:fructose-1,6-bisphosphatase/inositol monophosphatase family enzyme